MRKFLFLYPTREYINREVTVFDDMSVIKRLNEIINARYRQLGYQVNWLFFGQENKPHVPDMSLADHRISILAMDKIASAGLSREKHRKYIYPSCKQILSQLVPVSELVIGGFHQSDCVDRIARFAHRAGLTVAVDEDTTDQFFKTARLQGMPPVVRTREEYAFSLLSLLEGMKSVFPRAMIERAIQVHRTERSRKPWLVQI